MFSGKMHFHKNICVKFGCKKTSMRKLFRSTQQLTEHKFLR